VARIIFSLGLLLTLLVIPAFSQERAQPTKPRGGSVDRSHASGSNGAVVAGGPEAVDTGLAVLRSGGNAFDAAAATLLAQTVTDANQYCLGGEISILVYDAKRGVVEVVCGQGTAPRLATREVFAAKGGIPKSGILSAAVPGTLDVCLTVLDRYGTRTFAEIIAPTLKVLDRHEHPWHADLAGTIRTLIEAERQSPQDRSRGIRLVSDCFYRGPIARRIDAWAQKSGSLLRYSDLATHVTRVEEPVSATYRGHTVYKCGAWTQGPCLLQTLQMLDGFDLAGMGHNSPDAIHVAAEALKLALADRDTFLADPLFEDVPLAGMLSPSYAAARRGLIDLKLASLEIRPGNPRSGEALLGRADNRHGAPGKSNDTTTCLVADSAGNMVAATPSGWSGVVAGDTGVWLGTRLQSFNIWEGHPNCIVPGKRPRNTLTPTLVFKDGQPVIAVSVAGGDGQDQVALQMLLNLIDFGLSPADAVSAPRYVSQHFTSSFGQVPPDLGLLRINPEVGEQTLAELTRRGHKIEVNRRQIWTPTVLTRNPQNKLLQAAGDPKAGRHAAAY